MSCSEEKTDPGQSVSWYYVSTGVKIKSGGRFALNGISLKITDIQLKDAGTYECRGVSIRWYLTIYVNSEFPYAPVVRWFSISCFVTKLNHNVIFFVFVFVAVIKMFHD